MHLVLHIGPHKTGSSSIQKAFVGARRDLQEQGVLYYTPGFRTAWALAANYASPKARAHPALRRDFATDDEIRRWSEAAWSELEQEVAGSGADLCVLSSEHFASLPAENVPAFIAHLRRLFSGVTVIAYARDPVSLYLSGLQQNIQGGRRLVQLQGPYGARYKLRRQIERYADAVGAGHVVLRHFDRANLVGGDVVADFLDQLARLGKTVDIPTASTNESLPGAVIAWLLTVNETWDRDVQADGRKAVITALKRATSLSGLPRLKLDDPVFAAAVREGARADIAWLNRTFLDGQVPMAEAGPADLTRPPAAEIRAAMRDWIMSYLTTGAMAAIAREVVAIRR